MDAKTVSAFIILLTATEVYIATGAFCQMSKFGNCPSHELVSTNEFKGLIETEKLGVHCRKLFMALDCAQMSYIHDCNEMELLEYNMIRNIYTFICNSSVTEYNEKSKCINHENVYEVIQSIHSEIMLNQEDKEICTIISNNLDRIAQEVPPEACDQAGKKLLENLTASYFQPFRKWKSCPGYQETTPLTTTTTTTKAFVITTVKPGRTKAARAIVSEEIAKTGKVISEESTGRNGAATPGGYLGITFVILSLTCVILVPAY